MDSALVTFVERLSIWGVMDVFVPFILVFTLCFAILQKSKILGKEDDRRKFNVIVALAIALSVIVPHVTNSYPPGADVVNIINRALPGVSLFLIAMIMLLLMLGIWGKDLKFKGTSLGGFAIIISFVAIIFIFGQAAGWFGGQWPTWLNWLSNPDAQVIVVGILVFGIIIAFVTSEPNKEDRGKFFKGLGDIWNE